MKTSTFLLLSATATNLRITYAITADKEVSIPKYYTEISICFQWKYAALYKPEMMVVIPQI